MNKLICGRIVLTLSLLTTALLSNLALAGGEAGIISLRDQGNFYVGAEISEPNQNGAVTVKNQMYVGFQLVAEQQHPYPLILVHGGGGQAADWFTTPDGRDGWRDYFLAAGFDVYWVDRPGYGRSPSNVEYGDLPPGPDSSIISFLATSDMWPGDSSDPQDESVVNWLKGSMPGPYAGDAISAANLAELLDRVGPAIVVTHSAGGITGWWGSDLNPDMVKGLFAIEAVGSYVLGDNVRNGLTFNPPLAEDFTPVADAEGCGLQDSAAPSMLSNFQDFPVYLYGAEKGLIADLPCGLKALQQAGVDAEYIYLPDYGFNGNGHFMTADTNNGELAAQVIEILGSIE